VTGDKVIVKFVDYGNVVEVDVTELNLITTELLKLPAQAISCSLRGVKPAGLEWSDTHKKMEQIIDSVGLKVCKFLSRVFFFVFV
jgi:hypothetical protein